MIKDCRLSVAIPIALLILSILLIGFKGIPKSVDITGGTEIEWTNNTASVSAYWSGFTDTYSGIEFYEYAIELINKGLAYVCFLNADETREYRGTLKVAGKDSPYRNTSIEENLELLEKMKDGKFSEGECVCVPRSIWPARLCVCVILHCIAFASKNTIKLVMNGAFTQCMTLRTALEMLLKE